MRLHLLWGEGTDLRKRRHGAVLHLGQWVRVGRDVAREVAVLALGVHGGGRLDVDVGGLVNRQEVEVLRLQDLLQLFGLERLALGSPLELVGCVEEHVPWGVVLTRRAGRKRGFMAAALSGASARCSGERAARQTAAPFGVGRGRPPASSGPPRPSSGRWTCVWYRGETVLNQPPAPPRTSPAFLEADV
eukprot:CAMPEP_0182866608 /NCGR_PEP_ID=MMETSP0034_2-20130328/8291_1 /TAXON_ID=156128 /ORGANISM="Nephroselmis pyriformis, Strain CCMP717" /LENGTH=188 /DNA_ID=CAMNT_0024998937 /DNA_START=110 /DNA_END=677 /DNA_ORIENTATION=+